MDAKPENSNFASLIFLAVLVFLPLFVPAQLYGEVKVGAILPYSGMFARYGKVVRTGIEAGRAAGVEIVYEDERCEPMPAVRAYKKLTFVDGVKLFIGPICGSPQIAVAPLLVSNDQMALLGNAAPESVYTLSGKRMLSVQHSLESESSYIAAEMNRRGIRTVIILFSESNFSRTHEAAFRSAFNGKVIDTIALASEDATAVRGATLRIKKATPDAIFSPDASPILLGLTRELTRVDLNNLPVWSVYGTQTDSVLEAVGSYSGVLVYSYPDIGGEDALEYFPKKAMQMLSVAVNSCGEDVDCVLDYLTEHYQFNKSGFIESRFILKTIQGGKFIRYG